jgi:DnaK suppressor protein
VSTDQASIEAALQSRKETLTAELERLTAPPEEGVGVGFGKRVGDGTTEAVERISTTATARSIAASIAEIDAAILSIKDGSYGRCTGCGAAIPAARLEARPATSHCVDCAS